MGVGEGLRVGVGVGLGLGLGLTDLGDGLLLVQQAVGGRLPIAEHAERERALVPRPGTCGRVGVRVRVRVTVRVRVSVRPGTCVAAARKVKVRVRVKARPRTCVAGGVRRRRLAIAGADAAGRKSALRGELRAPQPPALADLGAPLRPERRGGLALVRVWVELGLGLGLRVGLGWVG